MTMSNQTKKKLKLSIGAKIEIAVNDQYTDYKSDEYTLIDVQNDFIEVSDKDNNLQLININYVSRIFKYKLKSEVN